MMARFWLCALTACTFGSGCHVIHQVNRTVHTEPGQFNYFGEQRRAKRYYRKLAQSALAQSQRCNTTWFSDDYADGFEDGYVDYLYAGGTGQPPPLPPRKYWGRKYQSELGHQAAQQWFTGFRAGAAAAKASGYRQLVTVPSSHELPVGHQSPLDPVGPTPADPLDPFDGPPVPPTSSHAEPIPAPAATK